MNIKKGMLIISIFALIIFFIVIIYGLTAAPHGDGGQDRGHPLIPTYILTISSIVLIIALIPLFYYIIYASLERNYEKNMEILSKTTGVNNHSESNDISKTNLTKLLLKFLSYNEKKVINKLIDQKGSVLQSEISRMESMGKVRTHRTITELKKKEIITVEPYGKTNRITLTDDAENVLLK